MNYLWGSRGIELGRVILRQIACAAISGLLVVVLLSAIRGFVRLPSKLAPTDAGAAPASSEPLLRCVRQIAELR